MVSTMGNKNNKLMNKESMSLKGKRRSLKSMRQPIPLYEGVVYKTGGVLQAKHSLFHTLTGRSL
jgi:hypothetical protein